MTRIKIWFKLYSSNGSQDHSISLEVEDPITFMDETFQRYALGVRVGGKRIVIPTSRILQVEYKDE